MSTFQRLALAAALSTAAGCHRTTSTREPDSKATKVPASGTTEAEEDPPLDLPARPFAVQESKLDNGMRVITLEDQSTPIAAVQVWYHVGSKDERPDRRGFAHMFEHMMFRGTQNIGPKAHFEYIRKVGGDANAFTSFDNTTYIQVVPSHQVEMVLWLEAERMAFLKINDGYFDTERKVVAEEFRLGREQPYGTALEKILAGVYGKHPYRWSPIGDMDELAAADSKELQAFWNTYYVPNNAALVVVGAVKHEEIEKLAKQYFGWIPRYDDPPQVTVREPEQTEAKKIAIKERNGPVPIVGLAYRTVPVSHDDALAVTMVAQILGGSESSRIYRDLVTERELAMVAVAGSFNLEQDGIVGLGAVLSPFGSEPDAVLTALREHVARIRKDGVTAQELRKARNGMLQGAVSGQLTVQSKATLIGMAAVVEGDVERVNRHFADIAGMTAERLQKAAQKYLVPEHEIEIRVEPDMFGFVMEQFKDKPGKAEDTGGGAEVIRGGGSGKPGLVRPAELGAAPPVADNPGNMRVEVDAQESTLANGLTVVVIHNDELPLVTWNLGLDYGAFADPTEAPGTASVALSMLTRGTKSHDYKALADELDTYAVSLSGSAAMDASNVVASAVAPQRERALRLLAEIVREPTFPDKELRQYVSQTRTGLAIAERSPDWLADRELRRQMFPGHPYARLPDAQARELDKIKRDGLAAWWQTHARPDAAVLYVAGDIEAKEAFALAEKYFGDWKVPGTKPKIDVPPAPARTPTKIWVVDRPANQAQIRVGHVGITRHDAQWPAARVLSDVLGGGFNSRLNDTIRVKKGLTYGASGGFSGSRFAGRFVVSTFSKTPTVAETVRAIIGELERMQKEAPSAREQADSESYLVGHFASQRETPQALLAEQWQLRYEGLPSDWWSQYLKAIDGVESKQVLATAKQLIHEDELVIVVVGPAKKLVPELKKIAPVEVVRP